jgi:streptogramin lyase
LLTAGEQPFQAHTGRLFALVQLLSPQEILMYSIPPSRKAVSSLDRPRAFALTPHSWTLPILAVLALLCGMSASLRAQTASFSGSTSTIDSSDFAGPMGVTTDASGNVFVADNAMTPNACNGNTARPSVCELPRTGPGTYSAPIPLPSGFTCPSSVSEPLPCLRGIAVDNGGNVWVADYDGGSNGLVYELKSSAGAYTTAPLAVTGPAPSGWGAPWGVSIDPSGNVFIGDYLNQTIAEISSTSIAAGTPAATTIVNTGLVQYPRGLAVDSNDDLFIIDGNVDRVVEIAPPYNSVNNANNYGFQGPGDLAIDALGNLWLSEYNTGLVRELTVASDYQTIQSWGSGLNGPTSVWPDADGAILESDNANLAIKQIATTVNLGAVALGSASTPQTLNFTFTGDADTTIQAPVVVTQGAAGLDFADAGTGTCTTTNSTANPWDPQTTCSVNVNFKPKSTGARYGAVKLLDASGNLLATAYVYGTGVGPQMVFPGNTAMQTLGGGFKSPLGGAVDASGNVYVADFGNNAVKEIPVGCASSACVKTLGGGFNGPRSVAIDGSGNLYVSDNGNDAVKEMTSACTSSACVTTLGGGFNGPRGVAVDASGNVYVSDYSTSSNSAVKEIPPGCAAASCVTTLNAAVSNPEGVAVDASGNVYVANSGNSTVQQILPNCNLSNCAAPIGPAAGVLNIAVDANGNVYPGDMAVDASGNLYVSSSSTSLVQVLNVVTPPSLSFANTNLGSQSNPLAVTVANIGNAPLLFSVPSTGFNPSVSAGFEWNDASTCEQTTSGSSAFALAADSTCTVAIDFQPIGAGIASGSVVLTDNNLNATSATQSIALSGTGVGSVPVASVLPSSVDFGTLYQGNIAIKTVTISNSGKAAMTINDPLLGIVKGGNSSEFITLNLCPKSLAAGKSCTMIVAFIAGPFYTQQTATLTINTSAGSPVAVPLTATVINPAAQLSAGSLNFGTVKTTNGTSTKSLTITSTGTTALSISKVAVTGAAAADYSVSSNCSGANLNPKATCSINLTFNPSAKGTRNASLVVTDNARNNTQSISLSGAGN